MKVTAKRANVEHALSASADELARRRHRKPVVNSEVVEALKPIKACESVGVLRPTHPEDPSLFDIP